MNQHDRKEILERKLAGMFPDEGVRSQAREILRTYGEESYERELDRVWLAILKVSEPSLESVRQNTQYAKADYRDVLAWAEYPNQLKHQSVKNEQEKQRLIEEDLKQYEEWLSG